MANSHNVGRVLLCSYTHVESIYSLPAAENFVRIGVTTLVTGNCGTSATIKEGFAADIVILNENTIADRATYDQAHQFQVGNRYVLVNRQLVLDRDKLTDSRPDVMRGPGFSNQTEVSRSY